MHSKEAKMTEAPWHFCRRTSDAPSTLVDETDNNIRVCVHRRKGHLRFADLVGLIPALNQPAGSPSAPLRPARRSRAIGSTLLTGGSSLSSQSLPSAWRRRSLMRATLTVYPRWIRTNPKGSNSGPTSPSGLRSTIGMRERMRTSVSPPVALRKYASSGSIPRCSLREI